MSLDVEGQTQLGPDRLLGTLRFAGVHLTLDMWDAQALDDVQVIERSLREAASACKATLLDVVLHRFEPCGVTGVAVLAESHISVHTWPEREYAAFDVFTCGQCDPYQAVPVLRDIFNPARVHVTEQKRGMTLETR
jgi:S-adenosylmethionine decarboxylase